MSVLVPSSRGSVDPRQVALFRGAAMVVLGLAVAFLVTSGQIRVVTLLLLIILGVLCLAPRRGTFIVLAFLPFMYFLRRQILHFDDFASRDPILMFPPVVTVAMILGIFVFYPDRVSHCVSRSALLKAVLALLLLFVAQAFNPLQGSIFVGVAGGLFFVIPPLWAFIGLMLDERDIRRIMTMVVIIGTVATLYGIYQHYFGFSEVERLELESKGFIKAFGEQPRIMSTFAGLSDFSLYMATMGVFCFARYWESRKQIFYLGLLGLNVFALLWSASRTSVLILAFSIITFLILYSKNPRLILARGIMALVVIGGLYGYLYSQSAEDIYAAHGSKNPFIVHTIAGVTHPTEEGSFKKRLMTYSYVMSRGLLDYPFGRGLGSTTTAASRFSGGRILTVDSYFFEIIHGSSLAAGILFIIVVATFLHHAMSLALRFPEVHAYKVCAGLLAGYFLGSIFGVCIRDTIGGPLAWLLIGWTAREYVRRFKDPQPGDLMEQAPA